MNEAAAMPEPHLDGAFRQISIAHNPAAAGVVNRGRIGLRKRGDLGFEDLGQKACAL